MSTQAMGWVLDHSPEEGAERLVLIAIANHSDKKPDDDAWCGWPGVKTIQREARLRRERTVQTVINRLIASGALERELNGGGDRKTRSDRRPNLYRIMMDHGVSCDDTRCTWCGVARDAPRGDAPRADEVSPDDLTGCRETPPEPKEEPTDEPKEEPGAPDGALFANTNGHAKGKPSATKARATRIGEHFTLTPEMRAWAGVETPSVDVEGETAKFADHARAKGSTYIDWVAAWRNWLRRSVDFAPRQSNAPNNGYRMSESGRMRE